MNDNDDDVLVAWLKLRGYRVVSIEGRTWLSRASWTDVRDATADDLDKWVGLMMPTSVNLRVELFNEQRGKRRPLRELVREWVIGL